MTLCRNNCLSYKNRVTYRAVFAFGKTGFSAGRCNSLVDYFCVSLCRYNSISITVTADRAGMCGIAVCCAGRSRYGIFIRVTLCRNVFGFENNMTNCTFNMLCSAVYTVGIFVCDPA